MNKKASPVRVFISYSHANDGLRERLRTHFSALERDGLVNAWDDRGIPAGTQWADEIDDRLDQADIILLLVSADFIASDYCFRKEMKRALERHEARDDRAIVIPVSLCKCDWPTGLFAKLQSLPQDKKPLSEWESDDHYFTAVAEGLRKRIGQLVDPDQPWLQRVTGRLRDPTWWQRPAPLLSLLAIVAVTGAAGWSWKQAVSEVEREMALGVAAMHTGRYTDAQDSLTPACRRHLVGKRACWAAAKADLGAMLESQAGPLPLETFEQGLKTLNAQALDLKTEDPDLLLFSGALKLRSVDPARRQETVLSAVADFKHVLQLDPHFAEAYYSLADIALNARDYAQAKTLLDHAVDSAPNAPHYLNARAYARYRLGDSVGAEADYKLSADNGAILSRVELAELLWRSGRYADAANQQQTALKELDNEKMRRTGRNWLPWGFELDAGRQLVLKSDEEKVCYLRLAERASRVLDGETVNADMPTCARPGSNIAVALDASLDRAMAGNNKRTKP